MQDFHSCDPGSIPGWRKLCFVFWGSPSSSGFPCGSAGKESACNVETWVWSLGWEDPLEKGKATHSSILAWRIRSTEEPGGLQSTGSQRVGHDWATNTHTLQKKKQEYLLTTLFGGWLEERKNHYSRIQAIKNRYLNYRAFRYSNHFLYRSSESPQNMRQSTKMCYHWLSLVPNLESYAKDFLWTRQWSLNTPICLF